ncbi:MAG: hypothetical protein V7775_14285 [Sulfitobacter sp.]
MTKDERYALGIEDNLIRVSVGIESFDLIKSEFEIGLAAAKVAS